MLPCKIKPIKQSGFAIILVILFGAIFSFLALSCWQQLSFFYDVTVERERFNKNFLLVQNLHKRAISLIKKDFNFIKNRLINEKILKIDLTSSINDFFLECGFEKQNYFIKGNLEAYFQIKLFENNKNKFYLKVILQKDCCCLSSIACLISKIGSLNENSVLVEYFTVNTSF